MENNLYYTPTIEEFHIGFEYEKYDNRIATYRENNYIPTNWHKFKYDLKSIRLSQLGTHLYSKTIRVKYLDQSDIESLGWVEQQDEVKYFELSNHRLYWFNSTIISIDKVFKADNNYVSISQIFRGSCKNISELKKLMQQLNIK